MSEGHEYKYMTQYDDVWCRMHGVKYYSSMPSVDLLNQDIQEWADHGLNGLRWTHNHNQNLACPICQFQLYQRTCRDMDFHQLEIRTTPDDAGMGHLVTWKLSGLDDDGKLSKGFWDWCKNRIFKGIMRQLEK